MINGDEKELSREDTVREQIDQEIDNAWEWFRSDPRGKTVLWSILERCGMQNFTFNGNSWDALMKGRQQVGSDILANNIYPHGMKFYTEMLLEAEERDNRIRAAIDEKNSEDG